MSDDTNTSNFDSRKKAIADGGGTPAQNTCRMWLAYIEAARKEEKKWRKNAKQAIDIYRGGMDDATDKDVDSQTWFNILNRNIETIIPAIYNSTPIPDIRRRFNDPGDVEKAVSDLLERALSYSTDQYDFDGLMRSCIFDGYAPGRGIARVRYLPYFEPGEKAEPGQHTGPEGAPPEGDEDQSEGEESLAYEETCCEYVPWEQFIRGPGRVWADLGWIAFEHFLDREQLTKLNDKLGPNIMLDCSVLSDDKDKQEAKPANGDIFGRARVYEIWDKVKRQVLFIAASYMDEPLKVGDDPLGLTEFFPCPRPIQPILTPGNMVPVTPYTIYRKLAEEMNDIQRRAKRLIAQLRVRGLYAAPTDQLEGILEADDGQLVPAPGLEAFISGGGLDKAISWWPMDPTVKALSVLSERFQITQALCDQLAGVADIMRGQTDPNETLGAQEIKTKWGSLRMQQMQADIARFARDLFRIKAEVIAQKFSMENLMMMTGVKLVPAAVKQQAQQAMQQMQQQAAMQAQQGQPGQPPAPPPQPPKELVDILSTPTVEEVEKLLRSNLMRSYKIDIESDSTIRADLTRDKGEMVEFMGASAKFLQGVAPLVEQKPEMEPLFVTLFGSFARLFRLGKQAEDALDKAEKSAANPQPKPEKPDPEMMKAQADIQAKQQTAQIDMQKAQMQVQLDQQKHEADMQMQREKMNLQREEMQMKLQAKMAETQMSLEMKAKEHEQNAAMAAEQHQRDAAMQQDRHGLEMQQIQSGNIMDAQRHQQDMAATSEKNQVALSGAKQKNALAAQAKPAVGSATKASNGGAKKPRGVRFNRGADGRLDNVEIS